MSPLLSLPAYQPLKNISFFKTAKADGMCIYWDDCINLCPDMVYSDSKVWENAEGAAPDEPNEKDYI